MFKYTIKRVLQSLLTVLIVVSIVSLLLSLMPTDYYFTEDELMKLTDEQKNAFYQRQACWTTHLSSSFIFLKICSCTETLGSPAGYRQAFQC